VIPGADERKKGTRVAAETRAARRRADRLVIFNQARPFPRRQRLADTQIRRLVERVSIRDLVDRRSDPIVIARPCRDR
jgi:hypothetical protein